MNTPTRSLSDLLSESLRWCRSSAAHFRQQRQFAATSHLEVGGDIAHDCVKASNAVAAAAHRAETDDREADRLIAAAQAPDSPGGAAITPAEMRPIRACIHRSAETDHDIAEHAHVPA